MDVSNPAGFSCGRVNATEKPGRMYFLPHNPNAPSLHITTLAASLHPIREPPKLSFRGFQISTEVCCLRCWAGHPPPSPGGKDSQVARWEPISSLFLGSLPPRIDLFLQPAAVLVVCPPLKVRSLPSLRKAQCRVRIVWRPFFVF